MELNHRKPTRKDYRRIGKIQKRLLLLLMGGLAFGMTRNFGKQIKILKEVGKEWSTIPDQTINIAIRSLYEAHFVEKRKLSDGKMEIIISKNGARRAMIENISELKIKRPKKWDGYFWIVLFDIPEKRKRIRDALRFHLKKMDFYELQKSVFILPFPCVKEIKFIAEYYNIREHIRIIEARSIDHEKEIIHHFKLKT
jgi:phenylacetic acid degradation operon negative regulatory protein